MTMMAYALFFTVSFIVSCTLANEKCRMITTDDHRDEVFSCVQATLADVDIIPDEAEWIRFAVSKLTNLPERTFARFSIRGLSFYNCELGNINADAFDGLKKLQRLTFYGSNIRMLKASWFKGLTNLTHLFLDHNDMVYIEPDVFSFIPNLEQLNIEDNNLNCLQRETFAPLKKLEKVQIGKNPWLCTCYKELVGWLRIRNIRYVVKNATKTKLECMMEPMKQQGELTIQSYKTYRNYSVSGSGYIGVSPAKHILCVGNNISAIWQIPDNVQSIEFVNSQIPEVPRLAFFRFGNNLRSLSLRNCSIREIHSEAFAGLAKLEKLILSNNSFSTVRTEWFRDLHSLKYLAVDSNGIEHIESDVYPLLDKLKHLNLGKNKIQCISTNDFNSLKHLTDKETPAQCPRVLE